MSTQTIADRQAAREMNAGMALISTSLEFQLLIMRQPWNKLTCHVTPEGAVIFCMRHRTSREIERVFLDPQAVIKFAADYNEAREWNCEV
jgi:hypothetical protein